MPLREERPKNFAGLGEQNLEKAKVVVLPVPYEGTVSYGSGTSGGPEAIIEASRYMELYDLELDFEPYQAGIYTAEALKVDDLSADKMIEEVEKKCRELVNQGKFVAMIGGEHSISYGADKVLREKYPDLTVLQWDAHADLRDSFGGTKFSHASVMRRFYDNAKKLVQVGIRSMSKEEADFIKKNNLRKNIFTPEEFNIKKILSRLGENVYITVDLDGFDPAIVPATGTPEPGGFSWLDFLALMRQVFQKKNVVGFDVVELAPIKGQPASDFLAALAVYKMIGYKFNKIK
jgi:agmatinase